MRDDPLPCGLERHLVLVLAELERVLEHLRLAELDSEARKRLAAARRKPQLGMGLVARRTELEPPHPGHDVSPVVEVEVREHDRVDVRPSFGSA